MRCWQKSQRAWQKRQANEAAGSSWVCLLGCFRAKHLRPLCFQGFLGEQKRTGRSARGPFQEHGGTGFAGPLVLSPFQGEAASAAQGVKRFQRLFLTGTSMSAGLISRTSSGTPQGKAGSTLILKWYMLCIAWWSSLRKVIVPLGVSKLMPSMALISVSVLVSPLVFLSAVTTAIAALKAPAVKKSGGLLNWL